MFLFVFFGGGSKKKQGFVPFFKLFIFIFFIFTCFHHIFSYLLFHHIETHFDSTIF